MSRSPIFAAMSYQKRDPRCPKVLAFPERPVVGDRVCVVLGKGEHVELREFRVTGVTLWAVDAHATDLKEQLHENPLTVWLAEITDADLTGPARPEIDRPGNLYHCDPIGL